MDSGDETAALITLADQESQDLVRFLIEDLDAASSEAVARLLAAQHEDEAARTVWNRIVLAGAAVRAFVTGAGGFVAIRCVLRPMVSVEKATRAMAAGDIGGVGTSVARWLKLFPHRVSTVPRD